MDPSDTSNGVTVDVGWIATRIGEPNVRLVEVDVNRAAYDEGHIPGAVLWNAYADLRDENYKPIDNAGFERLLSRSGLTPETTAVVYGYGAPLGFWLLKLYGHEDVRMLPGSRERWAQAGHEWSTAPPDLVEGAYPQTTKDADLLASREAVEATIRDPQRMLVDVRSELEYNGKRFWPSGATEDAGRAGHIPSAVSVPTDLLLEEAADLKSPERLREIFERAGVTKDKTVITYCTIGNRASHVWFALKYLLGYPDVQVYYGSWVEWGKATDTPIES